MNHNIKPGVATGREVQEIFKLAKKKGFALQAVNVIGSNSIKGVLETERDFNNIIDASVFIRVNIMVNTHASGISMQYQCRCEYRW